MFKYSYDTSSGRRDAPGAADELPHGSPDGDPSRRAVGNICLRFYNSNGEEIRDAVDDNRVFGLKLERLKSIPMVVGVACGRRKRQAILGALRGRWINVLVTDQFTAESLVMT